MLNRASWHRYSFYSGSIKQLTISEIKSNIPAASGSAPHAFTSTPGSP